MAVSPKYKTIRVAIEHDFDLIDASGCEWAAQIDDDGEITTGEFIDCEEAMAWAEKYLSKKYGLLPEEIEISDDGHGTSYSGTIEVIR